MLLILMLSCIWGVGGREGHLAGDVVTSLEEVLGDYSDPLRHEGQSLWIDR